MTNPEHAFQQKGPFTEARLYDNFDSWLTHIPEDRLRYLHEVSAQAISDEGTRDAATLTDLFGIVMLFSGKQALSISEVTRTFQALATYLDTELHVRCGNMTKAGVYALALEEDTAMITLTGKGKERYGQKKHEQHTSQ